MILHTLYNMIRPDNLRLRAKAQHPRKELGTDHHVRPNSEVTRSVGNNEHVSAQPVQNGAHQMIFKPHLHVCILTGEHAEGFTSIDRHVQGLIDLLTVPLLIQRGDLLHLVHAVVLDDPGLRVIGHQIVVFIVPGHGEGTDHIVHAAVAVLPLLGYIVLKVQKPDLPVAGDAVVDLIHVVVDGLIHGLDAVFYKDLPVKKLGAVYAGQRLNLLDEGRGLFVGDEFGGLHAVHQQLQLRQLKGAACHIIAEHAAPLAFLNIHAEGAQRLDVIVNAFALCGDAVGL